MGDVTERERRRLVEGRKNAEGMPGCFMCHGE